MILEQMKARIFEPKCIHRHTAKTHPHCFDKEGKVLPIMEHKVPRILIFDIETLPILGYTWGVWNTNIYESQVVKDWCVLSYATKWVGSDKVISDILTPEEAVSRNDKRLVTGFWNLLEQADVVVTHNGKRFDIRKINTRFWKNGLHKPHSYKVIDTLITAKSIFGLTYNSMDFIAKFIKAQEKLETNFALWAACDRGEQEALNYMRQYNEQDVFSLQEIYFSMREWIPNHPNLTLYANLENVCPVCIGKNYKKIGIYTANNKQYDEYRCSCGSVWHDTKAIKEQK